MDNHDLSNSYVFLDEVEEYKDTDTLPIRILINPYKNVEFRFQRVSFDVVNENLSINFDLEVMKSPENIKVDINDQEFVDFVGEILYDIIVNRQDINMTSSIDPSLGEEEDLEADVHQEPYGKNHS